MHTELGSVSGRLGDYQAGDEHLRQALELFTDLGDQASVGLVLFGLGALLGSQNRYDEALDHAVGALRLRRSIGDNASTAYSENAVGWILAHLGQPDADQVLAAPTGLAGHGGRGSLVSWPSCDYQATFPLGTYVCRVPDAATVTDGRP